VLASGIKVAKEHPRKAQSVVKLRDGPVLLNCLTEEFDGFVYGGRRFWNVRDFQRRAVPPIQVSIEGALVVVEFLDLRALYSFGQVPVWVRLAVDLGVILLTSEVKRCTTGGVPGGCR
jgi:hypothetical protein